MDIEIENQGTTWNLKDYFDNDNICSGYVEKPAWSPDGKIIAFFASGNPQLRDCGPNIPFKSNLYLLDSGEQTPIMVPGLFLSPYQPIWSFDSKDLAFWGCSNSPAACGIWVYSRKNDQVKMVAAGNFIDITWITDFEIAALKCKEDFCNEDPPEIWKYSVDKDNPS